MSSQRYKAILIGTTSALVMSVAGSSATLAQGSGESAQAVNGLEEIVVTARRVEENIQKVPIAITAFTPTEVSSQDLRDLYSMNKLTPGLNIIGSSSTGAATFVYMRGLAGVTNYFADVPKPVGGFGSNFDISGLQILKGPQGTLFGLASNSGAITITPNKPGETFGGYVQVDAGSRKRRTIMGAVDLPVVDDTLLVRLAGSSYTTDGYIRNLQRNINYGSLDVLILRPSVTFRPTETIESYTMFQMDARSGIAPIGYAETYNFSPLISLNSTMVTFMGGTQAAFNALRDQALAKQIALGPYTVVGSSNGCRRQDGTIVPGPTRVTTLDYPDVSCPSFKARDYFLTNTTSWEFMDGITFKNIFGYNWSRALNYGNSTTVGGDPGDKLFYCCNTNPRNFGFVIKGAPTWSDEIQILGKLFEDKLSFVIGNMNQATKNHPIITYGLTLNNLASASISKTSSRNRSVYGQGTYDLVDWVAGLSFTAGYRYSWDNVKSQTWGLNPTTLAVTAVTGGPTSPAGHGDFSSGSYTMQLTYQMTPDTMFFVNNSKGYSSGGLQNVVGFETFSPDTLNNLEVGAKSTFDLGGMTLRANLSAYYGWYDNVKVTVTKLVTNPATGAQGPAALTENAAVARIKGVDGEFQLVVTDDLELNGAFGYTSDHYTSWQSLDPFTRVPIDLSGTSFIFIPKFKYNAGATYHLPFVDRNKFGDVSISATWSHQGLMPITTKQRFVDSSGNPNSKFTCTRARTAANGHVLSADGKDAWVDCFLPRGNLDMAIDWKNVLNQDYLSVRFIATNVTKNILDNTCGNLDASFGTTCATPAIPRTFILQGRVNF